MAIPYVEPPGAPNGGDNGARAAGFGDYMQWKQAWDRQQESAGFDPGQAPNAQGVVERVPTPFNFDYVAEAQKAYGELGTYYDRILKESQGDMNKALARMVEDYDRGVRVRREDYGKAMDQTGEQVKASANARGIYQKSLYDPQGGFGLADAILAKAKEPVQTSFDRTNSEAALTRSRYETDTAEAQKRKEFDLEQQRRTQAATMANERGSQSYQKWSATNLA